MCVIQFFIEISCYLIINFWKVMCLQCFDTVGWHQEEHPACKKLSVKVSVWLLPSVLWLCWFGGRKGIRPVKTWMVVICLERGADLHMAQLMPLPLSISCFSKIEIGFTFLVPAHLGSPGQRAVKQVCVCVCVSVYYYYYYVMP